MFSVTPETRSLFQRLLFRDTLNELFRCGDCGASLVSNIGLGRVRDGELIDVPCPNCHHVWAFKRLDSALLTQPQLAPKDLAYLDQVVGDPIARMSMTTGTCARCGRELTDPDSIARGLGPDCADKVSPEGLKAAFWGDTYRPSP